MAMSLPAALLHHGPWLMVYGPPLINGLDSRKALGWEAGAGQPGRGLAQRLNFGCSRLPFTCSPKGLGTCNQGPVHLGGSRVLDGCCLYCG
jgi:hypothetical protein